MNFYYMGRNEMKPNVYREQPRQGNNRIIRCYSIIAIPSSKHSRISFTPHVGLRCALRQPTFRTMPNLYIETSQSGHQTCLGPTLAMSYPIDGRGRPECPAVSRPDRGGSRGRAARQRPSDGSRDKCKTQPNPSPRSAGCSWS